MYIPLGLCERMYVCTYVCTYINMCVCKYLHIIYVCMYINMYFVCMYDGIHVYT